MFKATKTESLCHDTVMLRHFCWSVSLSSHLTVLSDIEIIILLHHLITQSF